MKYLSVELLKISKSIESKISYLFTIVMVFIIIISFKMGDTSGVSNIDSVFLTLGNFNRYIMIYFVMILMTSLVVANEFNYGTYRYLMMRPVSLKQLLINKYIALWIFAGIILLLTSIVSFLVGTTLFGTGVLHGENQIELSQPLLRFIIFYIGTWINTFFIIQLTTYISILLKNNINTIVVTFSAIFVVLFLTRFVSDSILDFTPINYITLKPYIFNASIDWSHIIFGILITQIYGAFFSFLSLAKLKREDVG
ncbi:ABC transporter permease [Lacrimispora amygdalina]|uniref:ABC transporter permease n=1 Tax=Lacrimispora amygdalina TaxID=253257 RepID=UPI000BE2B10E|nr:ABC transporter permease [Lacrimispora amygdalina]